MFFPVSVFVSWSDVVRPGRCWGAVAGPSRGTISLTFNAMLDGEDRAA